MSTAAEAPSEGVDRRMGFPSAAILLREAARSSRQWRTYAARVAFSGALISIVLLAIALGTTAIAWTDPGTWGETGRKIFVGFAAVEVLVAMILAPSVVARAVIEEREERTLDLVVLSRLSPFQILSAKVLSSLMVLGTIVLGALPVLGIVTSLGGVSVVEVVAVTLDTIAALVILGLLGGFFALFTRSQVLATAAALVWALPTFLVVPWLYVSATFTVAGATHVSPLYGTAARGWEALLPLLAFLPVLFRTSRLATRVFALRSANASYGRIFQNDTWGLTYWLVEGGVLLLVAVSVLPMAVMTCWTIAIGQSSGSMTSTAPDLVLLGSRAFVWVWTVFAISWGTWIYLRLGSEWTIALDAMLNSTSSGRGRKSRPPLVAWNPVLWRETRPSQLGGWLVAGLTWLLILWAAFQSMLWIMPGVVLLLGAAHFVAAWAGSAWIASSTIERERREGTLELLLTTTMPAPSVAIGKLASVVLPTAPLVVVGFPLVVIGMPHALWIDLFGGGGSLTGENMVLLAARGTTTAMWATAFWMLVTTVSLAVAVRIPKARSAFWVNLGFALAVPLFPWLVAVAFQQLHFVQVAMRVVMPLASVQGNWWEPIPATVALTMATIVVFLVTCWRLRAWAARVMQ